MRSTYAANAEGLMDHGVCVDPSGLREGYQVSQGDTLEKTYLSVCIHLPVLLQVSFRTVVRITFKGGNGISTMFFPLLLGKHNAGVPSGCFTGSFWYGGIQCTVFHFLQTFLLSGHTLPYLPE